MLYVFSIKVILIYYDTFFKLKQANKPLIKKMQIMKIKCWKFQEFCKILAFYIVTNNISRLLYWFCFVALNVLVYTTIVVSGVK